MRRRVLIIGALLAAGLGVAGCGTGASSAPATSKGMPPPQALAGQSLAQREFGLLSGGDYGGAWDLWAAPAQQVLDRSSFVALNTQCRPALGEPYTITSVRADSGTVLTVFWRHGSATGTSSVIYQANQWRFAPGPDELADYRLGVPAVVAKRKAAGQCHA